MARDKNDDRDVARFLGDLGGEPVCRIAVHRYEPEWCAGYLGTFDVHEGDGLLMDTIRDEFGGGRLGLKVMGKGGRYLTHRMVRICAEIHEVGHRADRARENPSRDRAVADARDEIAALRDEVADLAARVEELEEQAEEHEKRQQEAEELARKAIALAEEGGEETPRERLDRTLAELREKRAAKDAQTFSMLLVMGMIAWLLKTE